MNAENDAPSQPVTLRRLRKQIDAGRKISMLTCYDATTARLLDQAGLDVLLVGDSAAQVILGFDSSIYAPLPFMLTITAAVKRGAPRCLVMGDMPFMSYQADDAEAIRNAGRFLTEGLADAVKLEVDLDHGELVGKLSRAGIPVVAHLGWRPQQARHAGVKTALIAGRTAREAEQLITAAAMMEAKGAVMLLIEQCPAEVSRRIVEQVRIPVIGCGAGPACHGHVVVLQDLLRMTDRAPSFVHPTGDVGAAIREAAAQWVQLLQSGAYLRDHPYHMDAGEAEKLERY
jgi:3-methyl-2-oxobutanoate hydroxymethyltransferase